MSVQTTLSRLLDAEPTVRGLARSLGCYCLDNVRAIESLLDDVPAGSIRFGQLLNAVIEIDDSRWAGLEAAGGGFSDLLEEPHIERAVGRLAATEPLAVLAFLRGLGRQLTCRFEVCEELLLLARGDVIPRAIRPTHKVYRGLTTPNPNSLDDSALMPNFVVYDPPRSMPWDVEIDFRDRAALDAATWDGDEKDGRFPLIATISPHKSFANDLSVTLGAGEFFDVRPVAFDASDVLDRLRDVRANGAQIAILPELSLPRPDELATALAAAPDDYPPLVVAGSAHAVVKARGRKFRVNESQVYLNGALLMSHRKVNPLIARIKSKTYREAIDHQPKTIRIAASSHTRLAVVICADLHSENLMALLRHLGVNLLLVPAMTPHEGGFQAVGLLAGHCQAVSVIANGAPPPRSGPPPFMVMLDLPRTSGGNRSYAPPANHRRAVGLIDPNVDPAAALRWI